MKTYTDIEQSKKLAEILPIESADMHYNNGSCRGVDYTEHFSAELMPYQEALHLMKIHKTNFMFQVIPCWSLAALLDILPPYLFEFERGIDLNIYPNLNGKGWHCSYMPNSIENMKTYKFKLITSEDTIIDACYEMIIKLHEQKLL